MLSIGRLAGARWSAEYYLAQQAGCPAEYYLGSGERSGIWVGRGAEVLGLTGPVNADAFRHLLAGRASDGSTRWAEPVPRVDPRAKLPAQPLVSALRSVSPSVEVTFGSSRLVDAYARLARPGAVVRADVARDLCAAAGLDPHAVFGKVYERALPYVDQRIDARLPGLDLTFSAPKSVSVLFGLAPDDVAAQVRQGHEEAVRQALAYLDGVAGRALRGHQGEHRRARRVPTDGFIAATFQHRSNRCGDMQLHDHVVVVNMLVGQDGEVSALDSALDSRELFQQARTAGFLYQAVLRHELTQQLGVDWTPVTHGYAEIVGIPQAVRDLFSKRRQQIEQTMAERGRTDAKSAQEATLDSRPAKPPGEDGVPLRERWAAEAREHGYDAARVLSVLDRARPESDVAAANVRQLTRDQSTFDRRDVLRAVAESLPYGASLERIEALAATAIAEPEVVPLLSSHDRRRYSTADLLADEQRGLALAGERCQAALSPGLAERAVARPGLNDGQREMVRRLLQSTARVDVVVGRAGSGKTTGLRVARDHWAASGVPVVGTAVAASTAQQLGALLDAPARSLTRLLGDADEVDPSSGQPVGLPQGGVVVLDEAGMVGTRQLVRLLEHVAASDARLICVGDPRQLPAVEAGGLFAALAARAGAITLDENVRQEQAWERDALDQISSGDVSTAVQAYVDHDRVVTAESADDLRQQMVDAWWQSRQSGADATMLAVRRVDVTALNRSARERLRTAGGLTGDNLPVDGGRLGRRDFAVGDEVIVVRNAYPLGLLNGTRGRVSAVDEERRTLTLETPAGRTTAVSAAFASDGLDHAYATTCHKAQGQTADIAMLYGTKALTRESGYVALSRGRRENYIFAVAEELDRTMRGGPVMDEVDDRPQQREAAAEGAVYESLTEALATSRRDELASTSVDPAVLSERLAAVGRRQRPALTWDDEAGRSQDISIAMEM